MIAIVAPGDDLSAKAVAEALERMGRSDVLWIDLEKAFETLTVSWRTDSGSLRWSVLAPAQAGGPRQMDQRDVSAVWWRRATRSLDSGFLRFPESSNLDAFETFWSLRWLLEALPDSAFPLGHPGPLERAENKHLQFKAAMETGFATPESCQSNDLAALKDFVLSQSAVAVKALRLPSITPKGEYDWRSARTIACKSFPPALLLEKLRGVTSTQLFCQRAITRTRDLRVFVLPHSVIAAEIQLSNLPENVLDWRPGLESSALRIVPIEPAFERQLREFLARMHLKAGHFDFALPDEGPPVFFECNPNGQWDWIQRLTGHPVAEAVARELVIAAD